eukprot:TRINITY_DN7529_c0_g1_i1.p1 TRINITY_DN7529_c0_g1~~TRINITY_DN7529_c0_g1_i1.p1  ORF type:complete len:660 (+),score=190.64 TRINITY_DN7529_c0_g1_i1:295-1980(+)
MVVSLETEQKLHLLRVIDELDAENRQLLRRVVEQDRLADTSQQAAPANYDDGSRDLLEGRVSELNRRNADLLDQLTRLQAILESSGIAQGAGNRSQQPVPVEQPVPMSRGTSYQSSLGEPIYEDARYGRAAPQREPSLHSVLEQGGAGNEEPLYENYDAAIELAQLADAMASDFASMRDQPTRPEDVREPIYSNAMTAVTGMTNTLQGALDVMAAALRGERPVSRPVSSAMDPQTRIELWGPETAKLLEEQEAYGNTPMPRESIRRQKKSLRKSSKKLRVRLGRLGQYGPDPTMLASTIPSTNTSNTSLNVSSSNLAAQFQQAATAPSTPGSVAAEPGFFPNDDGQSRRGSTPPPAPADQPGHTSPRVFAHHGQSQRELPEPTPHAADTFKRDLTIKAGQVRGATLGQRRLSQERLQTFGDNFHGRLVHLAERYASLTNTTLPNVTDENAEDVVLQLFADGYYFCVLINSRLQQRGMPPVLCYRSRLNPAVPEESVEMARTHVVDNFVNFQDGWRRLGMREADAPGWTDFTVLSDELQQAPSNRPKSLKILNAIEAVLNMQ